MAVDQIRILIVDDHTLFREGLAAMLNSVEGIKVTGQAATGKEAVSRAAETRPDIILMDIQMPDMNGIEATRQILKSCPESGIIIVTMFEDDDSVFAAMRSGARGYILKGAGQEEMLRAIRSVAQGEALFGSGVAARLVNYFAHPRPGSPTNAFPELTEREGQVLDLMARGYDNSEIARRLGLRPKTVRNHASNIFNKLQVAGRAEAIIQARNAGLGQKHTDQ